MKPEPFNAAPGIKDPALNNLFRWVREHPLQKHNRGVTWDFRCEQCGFTAENVSTLGRGDFLAEKEKRKIVQRISNLRDYNPVLCTVCAPIPNEEGNHE